MLAPASIDDAQCRPAGCVASHPGHRCNGRSPKGSRSRTSARWSRRDGGGFGRRGKAPVADGFGSLEKIADRRVAIRHRGLRDVAAFEERVKIHDLAMEGIDAVLRKRGYPSAESLKAGKRG